MHSITAQNFLLLIRGNRRSGKMSFGELHGNEKYLVNRKIFDMVQPYIQQRLVMIPKIKKIYMMQEAERQIIFNQSTRTHMTMHDVRKTLEV